MLIYVLEIFFVYISFIIGNKIMGSNDVIVIGSVFVI